MPQLDDGPTDGPPGRALQSVWATLSPEEATDLLDALLFLADEDAPVPGWHVHITDAEGRELTIAVSGDASIEPRDRPVIGDPPGPS